MFTAETLRLRIGVIGAGNISGIHLGALAQLADAGIHVVGICDLGQGKASAKAEAFAVPSVCPNAETLIASDQVDVVLVATPTEEHRRLSVLALKAGKHVVCEKPMAMSVAECDAMIAVAGASTVSLFVVQNRLYTGAMGKAREMIHAGEIGDVIHVLTEGYEGEELAQRMPSMTVDANGVIRTQMMHQTYVVPGLLGREITSVNVRSNNRGRVPMRALDVTASAIFTYDDGTIQTSIGTFGLSDGRTEHNLEIHGTDGDLRSTRVGGSGDRREILQHRCRGEQEWHDVKLREPRVLGPEFSAMWSAYAHSIHTGVEPPTTVAAARRSMVIIDAMYRSAALRGKPVSLSIGRSVEIVPKSAKRLGTVPRPGLPITAPLGRPDVAFGGQARSTVN